MPLVRGGIVGVERIYYSRVTTVDIADVLAGTQLDKIPYGGVLTVWAASSVADTGIKIQRGGDTIVDNRPLPLRANGQPSVADDLPYVIEVSPGDKVTVSIDVVGAGTCVINIVLTPG